MAVRNAIAVGVCRGRLNGVWGTLSQSRLEVGGTVTAQAPDGVDLDDAEAVGRWVGQVLRDAGFPKGKAILALSRDQVGFKRMTLPTTDPTELPDMTRLALQRELPFDATDAVIDFVPIDATQTSTTVLAVAAPNGVLEHGRAMLKAAGLGVEGVSLRVMGASALASGLGASPEEAVLSVDVNGYGAEFSIVGDGAVRFSRAAEFTNGTASNADSVITETRRTWMSYRIVEDAEDVSQAIVMGNQKVAREASPAIGDMLKVPTTVLDGHPLIDDRGTDLGSTWPLAGLLVQSVLAQPSINLAEPRKAPDVHARQRQWGLGVAGLVAVIVVGCGMLGMIRLEDLRTTESSLREEYGKKFPERLRLKRDEVKVDHLEHWQTIRVDWLDHLTEVAALAPRHGEIMLEQWGGRLETRGVQYDKKEKAWSAPYAVRIAVDGEADSRIVADAFRQALVQSDLYRARPVGAETVNGRRLGVAFTYTLQTIEGDPGPDLPESGDVETTPAENRAHGASSDDAGARTGDAS